MGNDQNFLANLYDLSDVFGSLFRCAVMTNNWELFSSLLNKGVNVNEKRPEEGSLWLLSHCYGSLPMIEALKKAGARLHPGEQEGDCLRYAARCGNTAVVKQWVQENRPTNERNEEGETALIVAARASNIEVVNVLLKASDVQIDACCEGEWSALKWAIFDNSPEMVSCLIKEGADLNAKDALGQGPLIWALKNKEINLNVIQVLLEAGAGDHRDLWDKNAMDYAYERAPKDVVDYMKVFFENQRLGHVIVKESSSGSMDSLNRSTPRL